MGLEKLENIKGRVGIFDLEAGRKLATQEWVRRSIIPKLIKRLTPTEKCLLDLHYASTWGIGSEKSRPGFQHQQIFELSDYAREMSANRVVKLAQETAGHRHSSIQIILPSEKGRGRYRVLGQIEIQNPNGGTTRETVWHFRGIEIYTREGSREYVAPRQDVDVLMSKLCQAYDDLEKQEGNNPVSTALRLAFFYTIGNVFIHPFIDGNHRAFDRFLEYGFTKSKIPFKLPQDSKGNIPFEEMFRIFSTNLLSNFLQENGLPLFRTKPTRKTDDAYQQKLIESIKSLIGKKLSDPFYLYWYATIAGELLKWTPNDQKSQILALQERTQKSGNFIVRYRH